MNAQPAGLMFQHISSNGKHYDYLGRWCCGIRKAYEIMKEGGISKEYRLSKGDIKRLENAGFECNHLRKKFTRNFDAYFKDLMAFRAEFGHFNVPLSKSRNNEHLYLGRWCSNMRLSYKTIKQGGITRRYTLSKSDIKRFENAGFEWDVRKAGTCIFDERFKELMAFKAEFGHVNVSQSKSRKNKHLSLGRWCCGIRKAYEIMKEGGISKDYKLSKGENLSALRMQDLSRFFLRNFLSMSASRISWRSEQSLGTSMCLNQNQVTKIIMILWEDGAVVLERHMKS